jgi:hypothetical protein
VANLLMGGAAGTIAATVCYPLDTIRRRMQVRGLAALLTANPTVKHTKADRWDKPWRLMLSFGLMA